MALWKSLTELFKRNREAQDFAKHLYSSSTLPYKIRSLFANWIESTNWDVDESQKYEVGKRLFEKLMDELNVKKKELQSQNCDFDMLMDLESAGDSLKNCDLKHKKRQRIPENYSHLRKFDEKLKNISGKVQSVFKRQNELIIEFNEKKEKQKKLLNTSGFDAESKKDSLQKGLQAIFNELVMTRNTLMNEIKEETRNFLCEIEKVWEEKMKWVEEQRKDMAGLSSVDENSLERLDDLFRQAGDLLLGWIAMARSAEGIYSIEIPGNEQDYLDLLKIIEQLKNVALKKHLDHVLIVEKQVRILKVNGRKSNSFQISIRILGGASLDQKYKSPKASLRFLYENDLEHIDTTSLLVSSSPSVHICPGGGDTEAGKRQFSSGVDSAPVVDLMQKSGACEIENGQPRNFREDQATSSFVANFYSLQLKNLSRLERPSKNNELVTDHKYGFLFQTEISILDRSYSLKTVSLPVVVVSQTSQEIMAKGTLIWDAAFQDESKTIYKVRESVPWKDFAHVLSALFLKHAGRELKPDHLLYLAKMAFNFKDKSVGQGTLPYDYFDKKEVSYNQIMKQKLHKKEFSFWKWISACLNLVSTLLKKEWKEELIYGFISKDEAKRQMGGKPTGTFLLRFSETNIDSSQKSEPCGFLTVAVQELDPDSGELKLFHVRDYLSSKDIEDKGLAPILEAMEVADYENPKQKNKLLKYLWPEGRRFSDVFGSYLKAKAANKGSGYCPGGRFTIEIFLSERRQTKEGYGEDLIPDTALGSVDSHMSAETDDFALNFLEFGASLPGEFLENISKPTATIQPAMHLQDDITEVLVFDRDNELFSEFSTPGLQDMIQDNGEMQEQDQTLSFNFSC